MTTADMVEATLWSWGVDSVMGRPLSYFLAAVIVSPTLLVDLADALDLDDVQRRHAQHLAHTLTAGLAADTVGGREWFLPATGTNE